MGSSEETAFLTLLHPLALLPLAKTSGQCLLVPCTCLATLERRLWDHAMRGVAVAAVAVAAAPGGIDVGCNLWVGCLYLFVWWWWCVRVRVRARARGFHESRLCFDLRIPSILPYGSLLYCLPRPAASRNRNGSLRGLVSMCVYAWYARHCCTLLYLTAVGLRGDAL